MKRVKAKRASPVVVYEPTLAAAEVLRLEVVRDLAAFKVPLRRHSPTVGATTWPTWRARCTPATCSEGLGVWLSAKGYKGVLCGVFWRTPRAAAGAWSLMKRYDSFILTEKTPDAKLPARACYVRQVNRHEGELPCRVWRPTPRSRLSTGSMSAPT